MECHPHLTGNGRGLKMVWGDLAKKPQLGVDGYEWSVRLYERSQAQPSALAPLPYSQEFAFCPHTTFDRMLLRCV